MKTNKVKRLNLNNEQKKVLEEAGRFNLVCGNSQSLAFEIATEAALDSKSVAFVFPNRTMMDAAFMPMSERLRHITFGIERIGTSKEIFLATNGSIKFLLSEDFECSSGTAFDVVIIKEAAMLGEQLKKIHKVANKAVEAFDGKVYLLSTPRYGSHFNKMWFKQRTKWKKFRL